MGKCRCYINAKTYAKAASKGLAMRGYKPCPVHEQKSMPTRADICVQGCELKRRSGEDTCERMGHCVCP